MRCLQWEQGRLSLSAPIPDLGWTQSSPAHSPAPELRGKLRQVSCSVLCLAKNKEQAGSPCLYHCQIGALKSEIKYSKT